MPLDAPAPAGGPSTRSLIYVSYSRRDRKLVEQLLAYLRPLRQLMGNVDIFYDALIPAGESFEAALTRQLDAATIVLCCLSPDSIASRYCQNEMERALADPRKRVIPILLRSCDWTSTKIAHLRVLPRDARPVTAWKKREEALADIASGLLQAIAVADETARPAMVAAAAAPVEARPAAVVTPPSKHLAAVNRIAVTSDGTRAVSVSDDGTAIVWDLNSMRPLLTTAFEHGPVGDVVMTSDATHAWAACEKGIVHWDVRDGAIVNIYPPSGMTCLAVSGDRLIVPVRSGPILTAPLTGGSLVPAELPWHTSDPFGEVAVVDVDGREDGSELAAALANGRCALISMDPNPPATTFRTVATSPIAEIRAVSNSSNYVACCLDGTVHVFGAIGPVRTFAVASSPLHGIAPMTDGKRAAVAAADALKVIDLTSGATLHDWPVTDAPTAVATTPDGTRVIWGTASGAVSARAVDTSVRQPLPQGIDRLRLAYLAVLELPEMWSVLETLDESALSGIGAQLGLAPGQDALAFLQARRPGVEPPPLWTAWIETLHPGRIGKGQAPR